MPAYANGQRYTSKGGPERERFPDPNASWGRTGAVKRGDHLPPTYEHGSWRFAGSDRKRRAAKWRCPTGEYKPASTWIAADRLHSLVPRDTVRWKVSVPAPCLERESLRVQRWSRSEHETVQAVDKARRRHTANAMVVHGEVTLLVPRPRVARRYAGANYW